MDPGHRQKYQELVALLGELDGVVVAFSGGVDSSLLLAAAVEALGDRCVAVTAHSHSSPPGERQDAERIASSLKSRHSFIKTAELENIKYQENPPDRCYFCKIELFSQLSKYGKTNNISAIIEGSNTDDLSDHRPGRLALQELSVRSPLVEVGLSKPEIRMLAHELGLPVWDKPSLACLASRVPYGQPITEEKLKRIGAAEATLRELGLGQLRVRDHEGPTARIEVLPEEIPRLVEPEFRREVTERLRALGYTYVTLDLLGYRSGSMNEALADFGGKQAPPSNPGGLS